MKFYNLGHKTFETDFLVTFIAFKSKLQIPANPPPPRSRYQHGASSSPLLNCSSWKAAGKSMKQSVY